MISPAAFLVVWLVSIHFPPVIVKLHECIRNTAEDHTHSLTVPLTYLQQLTSSFWHLSDLSVMY
jgi:hypothetical protein